MKKSFKLNILLLVLLMITCWVSLRVGFLDVIDYRLLAELRLSRVLLAMSVGIALTTSGIVLQTLFSNPLCDPYILGISSGASLGAALFRGSFLGFTLGLSKMRLGALIGALLFSVILSFFWRKLKLGLSGLLIFGVVLGMLGSSLLSLWLAFTSPQGINELMSWMLGDLSRAQLIPSIITLLFTLLLWLWLWLKRYRELDVMLLGETQAKVSGVDTMRIQKELFFIVSCLVALSVASAGMIGFVGLVIPNLLRKYFGSKHRDLLYLSALLGSLVLVVSDLISRVILFPVELPIGVVSSLIGIPLVLVVLLQRIQRSG
jgi:ABC-type Fe3+-siderophore transport system permease subunit